MNAQLWDSLKVRGLQLDPFSADDGPVLAPVALWPTSPESNSILAMVRTPLVKY
jgi:hypothetical protein